MNLSKLFTYLGLGFLLLGVLFWLAPKVPGLDRLGRLPGDVRIEREKFSFYFPWVTCLLISALLTLIVRLFQGGGK